MGIIVDGGDFRKIYGRTGMNGMLRFASIIIRWFFFYDIKKDAVAIGIPCTIMLFINDELSSEFKLLFCNIHLAQGYFSSGLAATYHRRTYDAKTVRALIAVCLITFHRLMYAVFITANRMLNTPERPCRGLLSQ